MQTRKTIYGWIVSGDTVDIDRVVLRDLGNGPEVPGELDDVEGPYDSEDEAIAAYDELHQQVLYADAGWSIRATEDGEIHARHADTGEPYSLEVVWPGAEGGWVIADSIQVLRDTLDDEDAETAVAAEIANRLVERGQLRVARVIHSLPGASPLGAVMI